MPSPPAERKVLLLRVTVFLNKVPTNSNYLPIWVVFKDFVTSFQWWIRKTRLYPLVVYHLQLSHPRFVSCVFCTIWTFLRDLHLCAMVASSSLGGGVYWSTWIFVDQQSLGHGMWIIINYKPLMGWWSKELGIYIYIILCVCVIFFCFFPMDYVESGHLNVGVDGVLPTLVEYLVSTLWGKSETLEVQLGDTRILENPSRSKGTPSMPPNHARS